MIFIYLVKLWIIGIKNIFINYSIIIEEKNAAVTCSSTSLQVNHHRAEGFNFCELISLEPAGAKS